LVGGPYYDRGGNAASNAARLVCPQIPQSIWYPTDPQQGVLHLLDCAGRAAALRHPYAVARAYLRTHPRTLFGLTNTLRDEYEDTTGLATQVTVRISGAAGGAASITIGSVHAPSGGLATLTRSSTLAPADRIYHALPATADRSITFRLPANWYFRIKLSGAATIASVTQRVG
jgi:hypothetical protein